jgi:hypothetical protein
MSRIRTCAATAAPLIIEVDGLFSLIGELRWGSPPASPRSDRAIQAADPAKPLGRRHFVRVLNFWRFLCCATGRSRSAHAEFVP